MTLGEILHVLRDAYCRTIGIEYMHIQEPEREALDPGAGRGRAPPSSTPTSSATSSSRLNAAEAFEKFLATKYVGQKRFGIEGAESAIPILDAILERGRRRRASTAPCMGMAHRGRLNVLANIVGKTYDQLFKEFEGYVDPDSTQGSGDVKYHLGQTGKFVSRARQRHRGRAGRQPVATSRPSTRSSSAWPGPSRTSSTDPRRFSVLPILIHGDAAFAGQGVVAETLNLSTSRATGSAARST